MNIQIFEILRGSLTTNLDTAGQTFSYLHSPYRGSSERLTSRVQTLCKRAPTDFEYFHIHQLFLTWSKRSKFIRVAIAGV